MLKHEDNYYVLTEKIYVGIKRHQTIIDVLFTAVVMLLVTSGTLCIGCDLEIEQLLHSIRKPVPLAIGLFCQLVYLPLLSLAISKIFRLENSASLGLLSTASCPGNVACLSIDVPSRLGIPLQVEVRRTSIRHCSVVTLICR